MDRIEIELADDMTLGTLRAIAKGMGKRLVVSFSFGTQPYASRVARSRAATAAKSDVSKGPVRRRRRRKLSPEAHAALLRNLAKARAARARNLKAAKRAKAPRRPNALRKPNGAAAKEPTG